MVRPRPLCAAFVAFASFGLSCAKLPVLAYVTPWNPRGKQLVDDFRHKIDIVSPTWYTIVPDQDPAIVYRVDGAPDQHDVAWYQRLKKSQPWPNWLDRVQMKPDQAPIRVTPRFILDGWTQNDYSDLLFNQTRMDLLGLQIWRVVDAMSYDGIVFESAATHAMAAVLTPLSLLLHSRGKIMTLVMPPVRPETATVLEAVPTLATITDYFSIMTYDMTGPGGSHAAFKFPEKSKLEGARGHGQLREPGPNTSLDWIKSNLGAYHAASKEPAPAFELPPQFQFASNVSAKFLMGLPLYGYTYPVMFGSLATGDTIPKPGNPTDTVVLLRGSANAMTAVESEAVISTQKPVVQRSPDGESFIDYTAEGGDWRAFIPTSTSISAITNAIRMESARSVPAGLALWEMGQASIDLLKVL